VYCAKRIVVEKLRRKRRVIKVLIRFILSPAINELNFA
jgi:hypothetical protein